MRKVPAAFYQRSNVVQIAKELLGKILVTNWSGIVTSGRIVECEAYAGIIDKASHASGGRRTARNEIMYGEGGYAYVYLCYGIHHLFNIVNNSTDVPMQFYRALDPLEGIEEMLLRTNKRIGPNADSWTRQCVKGVGNLYKAFGYPLFENKIFVKDDGKKFSQKEIQALLELESSM
jgi:DNA-3-methyladenine glycosylase